MSVANISKSHYEGYSYRELQSLAKGLKIPANLKKQYLIELIVAHKSNQNFLFKSIVQTAMNEREVTAKGKGKKSSSSISVRLQSKYNQVRLAPKQPYVLLKTDEILQTTTSFARQTRSKKTISKFPNLQRNSTTLALSRAQFSNQQTSFKRFRVEKMSCTRTNVIQENVLNLSERSCESSTMATTAKAPRKNATMLETLLQAPMSSKLEDIAADCMRGEDSQQAVQRARTVKVVGDAEVKRPNTTTDDFLENDPIDSLIEDVTTEEIMDLRVVGSEAKQLQWDSEHIDDTHNVSSSIEDSYLQSNLSQCYPNFGEYSSSSDHDHQYRNTITDAFGMIHKKTVLDNHCSQESTEVDNLIDSLTSEQPHEGCTSLDNSIEILENPIKCQGSERMDYSMNFEAGDVNHKSIYDNHYATGVDQSDGNHGGDFYNDSVVQDSSYYSLDRPDQMSPRTYNSIFTEYLLTEMEGHEAEYPENYASSEKQQQNANDMSQNSSFLDAPSQGLEHDGSMNLHQDLLRGEAIQDNIEQPEYPVLSLGSGEIGESEFDPITSALTLNFPNYGSLGLSPPHVEEAMDQGNLEKTKETATRQSKKSSKWGKTSESSESTATPSATLCFMCNWIGKFSSLESHIHRIHYRQIIQSDRGMVSLEVNVQALASGLHPTKEQAIFQHRDRLYVIKFKFTQPNIFSTFVLGIPPQGVDTILETPVVCFIQVTDPTNGEGVDWNGCVEHLNLSQSLKSLREGCFLSRKHKTNASKCEMRLKEYCSSNVSNLNSEDVRKLTVEVMVQTYKDVFELENAAEKRATYL